MAGRLTARISACAGQGTTQVVGGNCAPIGFIQGGCVIGEPLPGTAGGVRENLSSSTGSNDTTDPGNDTSLEPSVTGAGKSPCKPTPQQPNCGNTITGTAAFDDEDPDSAAAKTAQKWAYYGVRRDHPGYDDALKSRVNPRNPNGTATPEVHNSGATADSPYISWTRDPAIARIFAGEDGVVVRVPRGEGSPYKFEWSPDEFAEQEILIRGPGCGALIC